MRCVSSMNSHGHLREMKRECLGQSYECLNSVPSGCSLPHIPCPLQSSRGEMSLGDVSPLEIPGLFHVVFRAASFLSLISIQGAPRPHS